MPNKGNAAANKLLQKLFAARALAAYKGLYKHVSFTEEIDRRYMSYRKVKVENFQKPGGF